MANLVIMESPAKASTVKGYLGSSYKVVASKGHVRDLPKSTLGVDIENGFEPKYINIRGKGELIKELRRDAKNAGKVYLMTDPDREGEAIAWHLANTLGIPVDQALRVSVNEITKNKVKEAVKKPRHIDMDLVNAQQTRRILDRIVGYKLSPYLWKSVRSGLSAGRVQSVAARMIVDREREIRAFVPEEYWTIDASLTASSGELFTARFWGELPEGGAPRAVELKNSGDADKIVDFCRGRDFTVTSVKKAAKAKNPAPPFTTSTLLVEAARKLGFQSQRIMKTAQELYEGMDLGPENGGSHGLITYMRTDSTRVSDEAAAAAKELILDRYGEKYFPSSQRQYKTDAGAQDAHEAIRPSDPAILPEAVKGRLTQDQYRLYKLIWSRFIASQMSSAILDTVSAEIMCGSYIFRASGYTVGFKGYMTVYEESEQAEDEDRTKPDSGDKPSKTLLPELSQGDRLKAADVIPQQHFTEPPPRYTEASLIKRFKELGIGRPSTWTPIITTIISRGYVTREGKSLLPTPLGETTTELMEKNFEDVVDYRFTANMEDELDDIENGTRTMQDVLGAFYSGFSRDLDQAQKNLGGEKAEVAPEMTDLICEKCGARMIVKTGRFGRFAACPNYPKCRNTKPLGDDGKPAETVPAPDGIKCEVCGSPMIVKTGRWGSFYACSRYPDCKYTKRIEKEIGVKCPDCGGKLVVRRGKSKRVFYGCSNYPTCTFASYDLPTSEKCPVCGDMLMAKRGRSAKLVCRNKDCGYSRPDDRPEAKKPQSGDESDE